VARSAIGLCASQYFAANLLSRGNAPLAHIAEDMGYQTDAAFSRAFRREYGAPAAAGRRSQSARKVH